MDTASIMAMLQDKLPKDQASLIPLREKLDNASEAKKRRVRKKLAFSQSQKPCACVLGRKFFIWHLWCR